MAGPEESRWYLDAWDASAGRAFASYRRTGIGAIQPEADTYFISPPYFNPQQVGSQVVGFAASRGSFQSGFFVNGVEQPFDSLDELIDLVRRIYSSRGMWPGPGGAVPPAPPPVAPVTPAEPAPMPGRCPSA